jgi:hypothetical protein
MPRITSTWQIALALASAACGTPQLAPSPLQPLPLSDCERSGESLAASQPQARLSDPICTQIDPRALESAAPGARLRFPLARDLDVEAWRVGGSSLGGARRSWVGQTAAGWRVVLVVWDGQVSGSVHTRDAIYRVISHGHDRVEIARLSRTLPPDHPPGRRARRLAGVADRAASSARVTVDVLVEYTRKARAACPTVEADVHTAIAETNLASRDSAIDVSFELVDLLQAPRFRETGRMDDDLYLFEHQGDTALEEVHPRRDRSGADVAVLVVDEDGSYLGEAASIMGHGGERVRGGGLSLPDRAAGAGTRARTPHGAAPRRRSRVTAVRGRPRLPPRCDPRGSRVGHDHGGGLPGLRQDPPVVEPWRSLSGDRGG